MEEDDKKEAAAKMIGTSTTDHQEKEDDDDDIFQQLPPLKNLQINEEPSQTETGTSSKKRKQVGGDAAMNDSSPKITPKKRKEVIGGDVAMDNPSTFPLPLDSSPSLTPKKRKEVIGDVAMNNPSTFPLPLDSSPILTPKNRKEGPSQTTSAETPTKRRLGRPPGTSGGKLTPYMIELNAGEDVVDVIYNISQENRRKTIIILSASGSVSDIVNLTPVGRALHQGVFEIHSMSIKSPVDDDGRHCREKTMCTVVCTDNEGNLYGKTNINSLVVADRVKITAALFRTDTAVKTGAIISAFAAAARNDQMIPANLVPAREKEEGSTMLVEGETSGFLPTTPSVADADMINPTGTSTSTSNDQDMKSPSLGDT